MIVRSWMLAILLGAVSVSQSVAQEASEQCVSAFKDNMSYISTASHTKLVIEAVAKNECRSDGTAINAGYSDSSESLLGMASEALDITGSYASTSEFCQAYKENRLNFSTSDNYERRPLEAMAAQFNSCMATARDYRIALTSTRNGPQEVVYTGVFYGSGQAELSFKLNASANGAVCRLVTPTGGRAFRGREVTVTNEFSVSCIREGKEVDDAVLYKAADINLWFNGRHYPTVMSADRVYNYPEGPKSALEAKALVDAAKAETQQAVARSNELSSELSVLKSRVLVPRIAYVGEKPRSFYQISHVFNQEPASPANVIQYPCDFKLRQNGGFLDGAIQPDRNVLGEKVANRACGGKAKVHSWHFMGHENNDHCDYDTYSMICVK